MAPRGPPRVRRLRKELAATCAIRKECVRYRGLNRSGGGDWRGNSPRPSSAMRGVGGRTAVPSNRCGRQGGCEPATASSRSPGGSLRERRAASDRRLWEAVICRGTMRCPRVTLLTGRHGTSCRGDGSGPLLECRKARGPLRSKRWLASAAARRTRGPGIRVLTVRMRRLFRESIEILFMRQPPSGGLRWSTTHHCVTLRKSAHRSLRETEDRLHRRGTANVLDARSWRLNVRPAWMFGPSIRRGSLRDPPDRSNH